MSFKKRAPRAIKEIRDFAVKAMVRLPAPNPSSLGICHGVSVPLRAFCINLMPGSLVGLKQQADYDAGVK